MRATVKGTMCMCFPLYYTEKQYKLKCGCTEWRVLELLQSQHCKYSYDITPFILQATATMPIKPLS